MTVSPPAAGAIVAAEVDTRNRRPAVESARRHDTLDALARSFDGISKTLAKQFTLDATFEPASDGFAEETPSCFMEYNGERIYTWHDIVLTGWMVVAGSRVADVRAVASVLDRHTAVDVVVRVSTPRRWLPPKRTRVRDVVELRAALGV